MIDNIKVRVDPISYARSLGVKIENDVRLISIRPGIGTFGTEPYLIQIGQHVTVSGGVQFVTHDGGVWVFRQLEPDIERFGKIIIGNNVFLGYGVVIMPNVSIGDNVVIGAGSVVTKDIPPNCVAVGVPARPIKSLSEYYEQIRSSKVNNLRGLPHSEKRKVLVETMWGK